MKKKILQSGLALLLCMPLAVSSQTITLHKQGTTTTFTSALICSGASVDNPKMKLTVSGLSPAVGPNSGITLRVIVRDPVTNTVIAQKILNQATVFTPQSNSGTISWDIDIATNAIGTFITPNAGGAGSDAFTRIDGNYQFQGDYQDANNIPRQFFTTSFLIIEGNLPDIKIGAQGSAFSSLPQGNRFTVLEGCVSNDPRLFVNPNQCGKDGFRILVSELDAAGNFTGPLVNKLLNASQLTDIISTTGIPLNGITDGTNTVILTAGKKYSVTCVYVGQGWKPTFGVLFYKAGTWDLVMQDNFSDNGFEPVDIFDNNVFNSPDLWNKLSNTANPNSTIHETPTFASLPGNTNKLLVEVTNIGCQPSDAGVPLRMFWTRARTDELWSEHWLFDTINTNFFPDPVTPTIKRPAGSEITITGASQSAPYNTSTSAFLLPIIAGGSTFQMPFANAPDWYPPHPAWYDASSGSISGAGHPVICLLARINEKNSLKDPILFEPTGTTDKILPYVKENNNVVTRNTHLVEQPGFFVIDPGGNGWNYGFGTVSVNNDNLLANTVNLCVDLMPDVSTSGLFDNHGTIEIGMTTPLYNAWLAGGMQSTNIVPASTTLFTVTNSTHACLENITLPPGFHEQIGLRFNYDVNSMPTSPRQYFYQLSQSSGSGETAVYGSNTVYIADVSNEIPEGWSVEKPGTNSVNGIEHASGLQIFPNPAGDYIVLNPGKQFVMSEIRVYDVTGRLVITAKVNDEETKAARLDIMSLSKGTYMILVADNDNNVKRAKFIKE